jgi:hypothetical protein
MIKRSLLAVIVTVTIIPSVSKAIDASSPCSVAVQAFDSHKRAGEILAGVPSPEVIEVGNYIMKEMDQLDRQYADAGKPRIWSDFSDAGKHAIAASAVANCRLHPRRTLHEAADAVYRSVRDIHIQLGIVK